MRARASSLAISKQLADPGSQDTMNELFRTNVSVRVDVWMECLDGSVRWVEWTLWYGMPQLNQPVRPSARLRVHKPGNGLVNEAERA